MQILNEQRGNGSISGEGATEQQSMIDVADLDSDIFILKFLLGGGQKTN